MNKDDLTLLLDTFYKLNQDIQRVEEQKQALLDELLTDDQKRLADKIRATFDPSISEMQVSLKEMEKHIRLSVIDLGESVITEQVKAIYTDGKVSWDSKKLEGYAVVNPEVLEFRSIGSPFVRLQLKKNGDEDD